MMKSFFFWICGSQVLWSVRKIPPPKTPSTTICKIAQNFVIIPTPFFVDAKMNIILR